MSATPILQHLWQSTWFAAGAWLVALVLRHNAARVRYWVWFAASVKFLVPFAALSWLGSLASPVRPAAGTAFMSVIDHITAPLAAPQITLHSAVAQNSLTGPLLVIWGLGCVALLVRWITRSFKVSAVAWRAASVPIVAPVPVRSTSSLSEPGVVGILRPVLLLPNGITEQLTPAELQAVLAHELWHVRRRDNLTAAIHMLVEAVFWFHPLVWWIGARLLEERECACDEAVLESGNVPETYAEGVLKVCRLYVESRIPCVAGVSGANLKKRIEVIMKNPLTQPLTATLKMLLVAATAAAVLLPVFVGLLSASPASAQAPAAASVLPMSATVSIAPTTDTDKHVWILIGPDGKFVTHRIPTRELIAFANDVDKSQVIGGPDWLDTPLYDLSAHTGNLPTAQKAVKALLASRFGLIAHPETQTLPSFVLRVDAGGSKLLPAVGDSFATQFVSNGDGITIGTNIDPKSLSKMLTVWLGHPVVNQTGLEGKYNLTLKGLSPNMAPEAIVPLIRTQLGLDLESTAAPMDVVMVDQIERPTLDTSLTVKR